MSSSRRKSDVLIGSDCLDNKSLHFFNTIENYDPNEADHILTMHKSVKVSKSLPVLGDLYHLLILIIRELRIFTKEPNFHLWN